MQTCPVYRKGEVNLPSSPIPLTTDWDTYNEFSQERVWMSPEEFLKASASPGQFTKSSLDYIDNYAKEKGVLVGNLFMDVDAKTCRVIRHEGRHRSLWAYRNNVPCIPVILYHNARNVEGFYRFTDPSKSCLGKLKRQKDTIDTAWDAKDRPLFTA
jgi:hypothetical protein